MTNKLYVNLSIRKIKMQHFTDPVSLYQLSKSLPKNNTDTIKVSVLFFIEIIRKGFEVGAVVNEAPGELQSRE